MDEPLVSAIMPTMAGREEYREQAIACFESQTYRNRELVIVDDPGKVGAKRNMAVSRSRGEIICHWDDDDWSAAGRLQDQVRRLLSGDWELTGYHSMLFIEESGKQWYYRGVKSYALGTSLCYWKDAWRKRPFVATVDYGEDNHFVRSRRLISVDAGELMWARIHAGNTSEKRAKLRESDEWEEVA